MYLLLQINRHQNKTKQPELDMYADDFDEKEKAGLNSASTSKTDTQSSTNDGDEGKK